MSTSKSLGLRRIAALLALLGTMILSSGVMLMVAAAPSQAKALPAAVPAAQPAAAQPAIALGVKVCHAVAGNSDTNPYNYEILSVVDSLEHSLFHRVGPFVKTWTSAGTWNGVWHNAGALRPDYVVPLDPDFTESWCEAAPHAPVTADITWVEPSCANGNVASYETSGDNVSWAVDSGSATPGGDIVVKATADAGYRFAGNTASKSFEHTFAAAEDCTEYDATAGIEWVEPECANENTASWSATGDAFVTYALTEGTVGPGQTVTVTATAEDGHAFADETTTKEFEHTFDAAEICNIVLPPTEVTPGAPTFNDPTCSIDPSMSLPDPAPVVTRSPAARASELIDEQNIDGVHYVVTGNLVPGGTVDVDATALPGYEIAEGAQTHWTHEFTNPDCAVVDPPVADPGVVVVQPTLVHAGLVDAGAIVDPRGRQGLVLAVAGMALLLMAAALGFTPAVARRRAS